MRMNTVIGTAAGVLLLAAAAFAGKTSGNVKGKAAAAKATKSWGAIQSVDIARRKLSIKGKDGKVRVFQVKEDATITQGGANQKIAMNDLKVGEKVALIGQGDSVEKVHVSVKAAANRSKNAPAAPKKS